jgi:hypothetical protein
MTKRYKYRLPNWLIEFIVAAVLVFAIIVTLRSIAARAATTGDVKCTSYSSSQLSLC